MRARLFHQRGGCGRLLAAGVAAWLIHGAAYPAATAHYPAQPAAGAGVVCVSASGVVCFDEGDLTRRWSALAGRQTFEPVIAGSTLLVGGSSGLHAFDARTGAPHWHRESEGAVFSPTVAEGVAYATDRQGRIEALEIRTGEVLWQRRVEGWTYPPAIVAGRLVTGGRAGVLFAVEPGDGRVLWRRDLDQELVYRPVAVGSSVVVTTFAGTVAAFAPDGALLWQARDSVPSTSPEHADGLLVFPGMDGTLRARDASTGRLAWTAPLSGRLSVAGRADGGRVAAASSDGVAFVLETAGGSVVHRAAIPGAPVGGAIARGDGRWRVPYRAAGIISWLEASPPGVPAPSGSSR